MMTKDDRDKKHSRALRVEVQTDTPLPCIKITRGESVFEYVLVYPDEAGALLVALASAAAILTEGKE